MRPPLRYLTRKTDDRSVNVYENKRQGQLVREAEGKGLPETLDGSEGSASLGVGILGMRERVQQLGGTLAVQQRSFVAFAYHTNRPRRLSFP